MRRRSGPGLVSTLVAVMGLVGCGPTEQELTIVPVPTNAPSTVCLDALITGKLVAHGTWGIALQPAGTGRISKVLWPSGFHGVSDGTVLALVDGNGRIIGRIGDVIQSGGGFVGVNGDPDNTLMPCGEMRVSR